MITPTPKLILQFIEGNLKMLGDKFGTLADHTKEQVLYRSQVCKNDCMKKRILCPMWMLGSWKNVCN